MTEFADFSVFNNEKNITTTNNIGNEHPVVSVDNNEKNVVRSENGVNNDKNVENKENNVDNVNGDFANFEKLLDGVFFFFIFSYVILFYFFLVLFSWFNYGTGQSKKEIPPDIKVQQNTSLVFFF